MILRTFGALLALATTLSVMSGCAPPAPEGQVSAVNTLAVDAFAEILADPSHEYIVINVHIPYEGEIEGTDAHIPYNDLDALTGALPDKDAPIILYCRSGRMSAEASEALVERGYTQVWDVLGGMNAWRDSGRQIITR